MSVPSDRGKVLVTGATGHLGANLVRRLLQDGRDVRVLVRPGSDPGGVQGLAVERATGDLRDEAALVAATRGCESVFHCAALVSTIQGTPAHKREIYESNVIGTKNLLAAAARAEVARVVVSGSFSAVGFDPERPSEPSNEASSFYPFARHLPYAHTKVLVEHECWKAALRGLDVLVCTSTAILGPNDYRPSRMGQVLLKFANKKLHAYVSGGFEFVAARDIVEGHVLAMKRGRTGERYIVSSRFVTMDEIMDQFQALTGRPKPRRLPSSIVYGVARAGNAVLTRFFPKVEQLMTPDAILLLRTRRHADTTKARRELGFQPTALEDALRLAYEDFGRRGLIPTSRTIYVPAPARAQASLDLS